MPPLLTSHRRRSGAGPDREWWPHLGGGKATMPDRGSFQSQGLGHETTSQGREAVPRAARNVVHLRHHEGRNPHLAFFLFCL